MSPSLTAAELARPLLWRECLQVLALLLLVKCVLLVLDPDLRFFLGDSGSYLHAALSDWLPPDRSITYPWLVRISAVAAENAFALVALQTLFGAFSALIVFALLRVGAGLGFAWALVTSLLVAMEPSQLFYERMMMAESAGQLAFMLTLGALFGYVRSGRLRWLPGFVVAGLAAVTLRMSLLPVVLGLILLAPVLRACSHAAREDTGRPLVAALRGLGHAGLLAALVLAAHGSYRQYYAERMGGAPSYMRNEGQMRLGLVAPLIKSEHLERVGLDPVLLSTIEFPLRDLRNRESQMWMPGGLWQTLFESTVAVGRDPNDLARKIAIQALQDDPLALIRFGASTLSDYFDADHAAARMRSDLGTAPLSAEMAADVLRHLRYEASQLHDSLGPMARYFEASRPWMTAVLFAAVPLGLLLLIASRQWRPGRELAWVLGFTSLGFFAGQLLTSHIVSFRYLQPLPPLLLAMGSMLLWRFVCELRSSTVVSGPAAGRGAAWRQLDRLESLQRTLKAQFAAFVRRWLGPRVRFLSVLALGVAAAVGGLLDKGQDANWDLRNYHLYNPLALLTDRSDDLAFAQLQTWYNPLIDVPLYLLASAPISGLWASLWLLVPALLALALMLAIFQLPDRRETRPVFELLLCLVLMAAALGGAAAGPSLGTSFNEWPVAAAVLFALWALLRFDADSVACWRWLLAAGFCAGLVAGLKLTAVAYCLALGGLAAAVALRERSVKPLWAFALAGLCGGLLSAGPWAWTLWQQTGNPIFPYWNDLFRSEHALEFHFLYARFKPEGWGEALLAPLHLAQGGHVFSELELRDPRLLLGMLGSSLVLGRWAMLRRRGPQAFGVLESLALFWWFAFLSWISLHAIYRYTIALEITSLLVVAGLLLKLPSRYAWAGLVALLLAVQLGTLRPNWGRAPFSTPFIENRYPPLPESSVLLSLTGEPIGYTALGLPGDVPVLGLANNLVNATECRPWQVKALARIVAASALFSVQTSAQASEEAQTNAAAYGLHVTDECMQVPSTLAAFWLCRVERKAAPACH